MVETLFQPISAYKLWTLSPPKHFPLFSQRLFHFESFLFVLLEPFSCVETNTIYRENGEFYLNCHPIMESSKYHHKPHKHERQSPFPAVLKQTKRDLIYFWQNMFTLRPLTLKNQLFNYVKDRRKFSKLFLEWQSCLSYAETFLFYQNYRTIKMKACLYIRQFSFFFCQKNKIAFV